MSMHYTVMKFNGLGSLWVNIFVKLPWSHINFKYRKFTF